jgi:hypothetical protein
VKTISVVLELLLADRQVKRREMMTGVGWNMEDKNK